MKLTTRFRYGARAMLDLAIHSDQRPVSLKDIARRQGLSLKYLETLFSALHAAGLVRSVRGAQGGYQLTQPPGEITLRRLYEVLEGSSPLVDCTADPKVCSRAESCVTQRVWSQLYQVCAEFLEGITLKDLMDNAETVLPARQSYHI